MNNQRTGLAFLTAMFVAGTTSYAQHAAEDLARVNAAYRDAMELSMRSEYRVYASSLSPEVLQRDASEMRRSGARYYTSGFGRETVLTGGLLIEIDRENRRMILADAPPMRPEQLALSRIDLDSVLTRCSSISWWRPDSVTLAYRLQYDDAEYRWADLFIDTRTWLLRKSVLYTDEERVIDDAGTLGMPRVENMDVQTAPRHPAGLFDVAHYMTGTASGLVPAGAYAGYRFSDARGGSFGG